MFGDEEVTDEAGQEGSRRAFNDSTVSSLQRRSTTGTTLLGCCCVAVPLHPSVLINASFLFKQAISRREQVQQLATKCFRKGYPYLGAVSQLWLLSYNVAYLFDRTPYWRPWLQAMRVDIRRVGAEDYVSVPFLRSTQARCASCADPPPLLTAALSTTSSTRHAQPTSFTRSLRAPSHARLALHLLRSAQVRPAREYLLLQVPRMVVLVRQPASTPRRRFRRRCRRYDRLATLPRSQAITAPSQGSRLRKASQMARSTSRSYAFGAA